MRPFNQIRRGEDTDDEFSRVGNDHDPVILVPDDFGVSELVTSNIEHRVVFVFSKGVAVVVREGEVLGLLVGLIERVDCDYTVGLIRKEAGSVVGIDDSGAREDTGTLPRWVEGDRLIGPVVQVGRCSMTPVLITSDQSRRIVYTSDVTLFAFSLLCCDSHW